MPSKATITTDPDGTRQVVRLAQVGRTDIAAVGGKCASLGELQRMPGVQVPPGFCVSTHAYYRVVHAEPAISALLDQLTEHGTDEVDAGRATAQEIRNAIEKLPLPGDLAAEIAEAIDALGPETACAVRSSSTAEDLPTASFAGQQDTYLNVVGSADILEHISRCWASLFTERSVNYRRRLGIDHRRVGMAVVVQAMVFPDAAGVLFTADPVTSNRNVAAVEASFGLGEALVAGLVNPDVFRVRGGEVTDRAIAAKERAVRAAPAGGTQIRSVDPAEQRQPALTDQQVVRLVRLGRQIEAHFDAPQDIEWCLTGDDFQILQSRPITTLFPIPETGDEENHVFLSVGHQQMMTDPMKPLGLSIWQLTALAPMLEAGGRLFVDATSLLGTPSSRAAFLTLAARSDPLISDALQTILDRGGFVPLLPEPFTPQQRMGGSPAPGDPGGALDADPLDTDPAIVAELIEKSRSSIDELSRAISTKSGSALFEFLIEAFTEHRRALSDRRSMRAIMAGMEATWWLNENLQEWLGESNAAGTLIQSAPGNVTSEMGLALLDVADAIRPHPHVVAFLRTVRDESFLDELSDLPGGRESQDALREFLGRYGMRCVGEIDITRPRWSEQPSSLLPVILGNIDHFRTGEGKRRFERGLLDARAKEREILERLRALPDGAAKADETERMIRRVRAFIGYREYPKYALIQRFFLYKKALLEQAQRLSGAGVLSEAHDVFFLTFDEFRQAVRMGRVDGQLIQRRKEAFRSYGALPPPRVLTSEGEVVTGKYSHDNLPNGALAGLPVSGGIVEGRARVLLDIAQAHVAPGDILVTTYTDPSWSPLFVGISALVTEVGGMMTHGAVIAREYGLPAVVGVENATSLIRDGQRIRVNGTDGYLEILPDGGSSGS